MTLRVNNLTLVSQSWGLYSTCDISQTASIAIWKSFLHLRKPQSLSFSSTSLVLLLHNPSFGPVPSLTVIDSHNNSVTVRWSILEKLVSLSPVVKFWKLWEKFYYWIIYIIVKNFKPINIYCIIVMPHLHSIGI